MKERGLFINKDLKNRLKEVEDIDYGKLGYSLKWLAGDKKRKNKQDFLPTVY